MHKYSFNIRVYLILTTHERIVLSINLTQQTKVYLIPESELQKKNYEINYFIIFEFYLVNNLITNCCM